MTHERRVYDRQNREPGASTDTNIPSSVPDSSWQSSTPSSVIAHQEAVTERLNQNNGTIVDDVIAVASFLKSIIHR